MKYIDQLLIIVAAYSLFSLAVVFSNHYFAGINQFIPDIFSQLAIVSIGKTFHLVFAAVIAGLLLNRFAPKPVMAAVLAALAVNINSYILLITENSIAETWQYYQTYPSQIFVLFKPLIILPVVTYLYGLIIRADPPKQRTDQ